METRDHENSTLGFLPEGTTISVPHKDQLRERIKIEFYKTYDVMTGIRIAVTLGGFFSMMILLVLYKNYCKPSKTLSEEQLNAAVTAAAEEEDRALQAALEATSFYTSLEKRRQSLENASQILLSPRFSSVGGGYSHLTPPLKASVLQQRGKSLPGSVLQFTSSGSPSFFTKDLKSNGQTQEEDSESRRPDFFACKNYLNILPSRRVSSVTCSSTDSAYLERRCSAFEMGFPVPPYFLRHSREKLLGKKDEPWDFYYPIDIQVIQPTPEMSPTASERNLNEDYSVCGSALQVPGTHDQMHNLSVSNFEIGLAPLASISSLGGFSQSSSITSKSLNTSSSNFPVDNQGTCPDDSIGSDSVFMDIDELATDSEFESDGFDDDYSFCESKQKSSPTKSDLKTLQFASFDSYDTSIMQDLKSEIEDSEGANPVQPKPPVSDLVQQHQGDLKRYSSLHEGNRGRRKLIKTHSEPRSSKVPKTLPPWTEKGRSGYVPKRQMSSPSRRRNALKGSKTNQTLSKDVLSNTEAKTAADASKYETGSNRDVIKLLLPLSPNSSSSDSVTLTPNVQRSDSASTYLPTQGLNNDLPSKSQQKTHKQLSLPSTQEKRSRLQKQKNFNEEVVVANQAKEKTETHRLTGAEGSTNTFLASSGGLLKPPAISFTGSCEKLATLNASDDLDELTGLKINLNKFAGD